MSSDHFFSSFNFDLTIIIHSVDQQDSYLASGGFRKLQSRICVSDGMTSKSGS